MRGRKRIEEALKESEERFRALVQNASDLITILEADGTVRYDSPAIERMLGYGLEERVGTSAFDYIHPEEVPRVKRTFSETVDEYGVQPPVEFRIRHKDGSWRYIEATRSNLLDEPAVRRVVSNSRDVTERKKAERALRQERYRAVVERSVEAIYLFDPGTKQVLETNATLEGLLGYTADELDGSFIAGLGKDWEDTAIVSGTINLAHALELTVIGEGLETAGQLERLRELECDLVQGYYLSEPLAEDEIQELLAADPRRWPYR